MKTFNIAEVIQRKRKEYRLTQAELAQEMGVSKSSVSKWESGQTYPDIFLLPELATFFNVTIDELLGYSPQLSSRQIKEHYQLLAKSFANDDFTTTLNQCRELIRKYNACLPLLHQMSILILNHHNLAATANEQQEILAEVALLTQRVQRESTEPTEISQASIIEGMVLLLQKRFEEVIQRLGVVVEPYLGKEQILASAYANLGQVEMSREILQVSNYQSLLALVSNSTNLLHFYQQDEMKFKEICQRIRQLAVLFQLRKLHPASYLTFLLAEFQGLTAQYKIEEGLNNFAEVIEVMRELDYPLELHGDGYFDLVDHWIDDQLALSSTMPRNQAIVNESILAFFTSQGELKEIYGDEPRFEKLINQLKEIIEVSERGAGKC